jgi:hypothetical protein
MTTQQPDPDFVTPFMKTIHTHLKYFIDERFTITPFRQILTDLPVWTAFINYGNCACSVAICEHELGFVDRLATKFTYKILEWRVIEASEELSQFVDKHGAEA